MGITYEQQDDVLDKQGHSWCTGITIATFRGKGILQWQADMSTSLFSFFILNFRILAALTHQQTLRLPIKQ